MRFGWIAALLVALQAALPALHDPARTAAAAAQEHRHHQPAPAGDESDKRLQWPDCPICLALQHVGKALPAPTVPALAPLPTAIAAAVAVAAPVGTHRAGPQQARAPPSSAAER